MSRELETPLRKSLDSIDAFRRRITIAGWIVAASTFGAFYWLSHVTRTSDDPKKLLNAAVLAIAFLIACSTFALVLCMIRMPSEFFARSKLLHDCQRCRRYRPGSYSVITLTNMSRCSLVRNTAIPDKWRISINRATEMRECISELPH
ncbi:MAG: hypothetical protein DMG13_31755 [Acidobacteria bacterium]|nr:MAG: hypothetical protein DMG13_31755 [Acidobacteriota bacterium]